MVLDIAGLLSFNYLAVIVAAIVSFIIGMVWYSPALFGKVWIKANGFDEKKIKEKHKKGMAKGVVGGFVGSLVMGIVLSVAINLTQATTLSSGLLIGFFLWLGFVATTSLNKVLWEGKPLKLYLVDVLHYLVVVLVMSVIFVSWV